MQTVIFFRHYIIIICTQVISCVIDKLEVAVDKWYESDSLQFCSFELAEKIRLIIERDKTDSVLERVKKSACMILPKRYRYKVV